MKNIVKILVSSVLLLAMILSVASCGWLKPGEEEFYIDGPASVTMQVGEIVVLDLVKPDSLKGKVEWTVDDNSIAEVVKGTIVAKAEGITVVHATLDDYSDKIIVTVTTPKDNTGSNTGNNGGSTGGNTGNNGGSAGDNTGNNGGSTGGNTGNNGGSTGDNTGNSGGITGDNTGNSGGSTGGTDNVGAITASVVIADLISANSWNAETRKQSFSIDNVVSAQIDGGNFSGAAYSDQIRIYASDSPAGTLTISVASGYELVSIKVNTAEVDFLVANLCIDGSGSDISNVETSVSGSSVVIQAVKNGSDGKNARITSIEVVYRAV